MRKTDKKNENSFAQKRPPENFVGLPGLELKTYSRKCSVENQDFRGQNQRGEVISSSIDCCDFLCIQIICALGASFEKIKNLWLNG